MRAFLLACLFIWILPLQAADEEKDLVVLSEEKVHEGDYFAAGGTVEVSGVVKGDVYAFGSQVIIDGKVEGDVITAGGTVNITGLVLGDVRAAAGQIGISGAIGKNVTAIGGNIIFSKECTIGGGVILSGGLVELAGTINRNATVHASKLRVAGQIDGDVSATVGRLRLTSRADIKGNLAYSSSAEAIVDPGALIQGEIQYKQSVMKEIFRGRWMRSLAIGSRFIGLAMNFFFCLIVGLLLLKLFPQRVDAIITALKSHPWKSALIGLLVMILLPLISVLLFITILGFPFALALLAISLLSFYTAKIFFILWVSRFVCEKIGKKPDSRWAYFIALVIFFILTRIPVFGGILSFLVTIFGLGAIFIGRLKKQKPKKGKKRVAKAT